MHLAERDTGFLEHVLFLDAAADQIGLHLLDEFFQFELRGIIVNHRAFGHFRRGPVVIILVGEFVTGTGN